MFVREQFLFVLLTIGIGAEKMKNQLLWIEKKDIANCAAFTKTWLSAYVL